MTDSRKTAFISAAGRNIGRALALEFAGRGCNLVLNALSDRRSCEATAKDAETLGGVETLVVMGDVGREEVTSDIAAKALARFGTVDIVINNAGYRPHTPFLELTAEEWRRVLDINLNAAFHTIRAFAPGMAAKRWGRIVNVTGMNAMRGYVGRSAVSAAKHGLYGLTKALAKELGPSGITVNAISPGTIRTSRDTPEEYARVEKLALTIPARRIGAPEDIAALAGFLCSEQGGYVNGQMIASNGGAET